MNRDNSPSPLLTEAVRKGCEAMFSAMIGGCIYPRCKCEGHPTAIKASLAHVLSAEPSEALLQAMYHCDLSGELSKKPFPFSLRRWEAARDQLLRELGLKEGRSLASPGEEKNNG